MKNIFGFSILIITGFLSIQCSRPGKTEAQCGDDICWENLIQSHVRRYPLLQVEDLYKLLYQSTLGNGHAITDSTEAARWLAQDLNDNHNDPFEPLIDTLGPCGRFARVHIRTFIRNGGDPTDLLQAFLKTGKEIKPDSSSFHCALSAAQSMALEGKLPWNEDTLEKYFTEEERQHYPAVHHSLKFDSAYHPSYRVIGIKFLPGLLNKNNKKITDINPQSLADASRILRVNRLLPKQGKRDS